MNWKNIKSLSADDYGKPVLLRMTDEGYDGPRYAAARVGTDGIKVWGGVVELGDIQGVLVTDEPIPDNAHYIRIDEILF